MIAMRNLSPRVARMCSMIRSSTAVFSGPRNPLGMRTSGSLSQRPYYSILATAKLAGEDE